VRINAAVVAIDTESVVVEDGAQNAGSFDLMVFAGLDHDLACVSESEVLTRSLPERNGLSVDELSVLIVEGIALEEYVGRRTELGQHDNMLEILRGEALHAAHVEQRAHARQAVDGERHLISGIADEIGIEDGLLCSQLNSILRVVAGQEVDAASIAHAGVGSRTVHIVEGLCDHVVDGTHDEVVESDRHALLDLVQKHGQEGVELGGAGEGLIEGFLLHGALDLERGHLVEELDVHVGLVEDVGVIGLAVGEIPRLVLGGGRQTGTDLFENRAITPIIHHDGRRGAGVGTVDEYNLTNVVDEGTNEAVERVSIEDSVACIHNASEILLNEVIFTESLGERGVDYFVNLFYFHCYSPFKFQSYVPKIPAY